ncbi:hypothetical protein DL96DRAFT_1689352 [Flagelloscypha sp. PMI_526]|nr:hypothetical protein DL96DRAFT_1689352 [Flagelloscypha sp. PMI_526]
MDVDGISGSLLIACFVASLLFGITTAQASAVWMLETCRQVLFNHVSYTFLVRNYGYPDALVNAPKSLQALFVFSGLTGFIIRGFFIYRLHESSLMDESLSVAAFTDVTISATTFWLMRQCQVEALEVGCLIVFSAISASAYISQNICKPLFGGRTSRLINSLISYLYGIVTRITLREQGAGSCFAMNPKELSSLVFATFHEHSRGGDDEMNCTGVDERHDES